MMNHLCLIMCLFLAIPTSVSQAQQNSQEYLQGKVQKFTQMKNTGLVMLILGAASTSGGIILMSSADWDRTADVNGNTQYTSQDGNALAGMLFTGIGAGLIGGGLTLKIIGDKKSKKYRNQMEELTLVPIFRQNQAGVLLCLRF